MKKLIKVLPLILVLFILFSGCDKDDTNPEETNDDITNDNNDDNTTATSSPQFTGDINETAVNYSNLHVGYTSSGEASTDSGTPSKFQLGFILLDSDLKHIIHVEKGTLTIPSGYPSNEEFNAFFPLGTSEYDASLEDGVVIEYTDNSGQKWSTAFGSAEQTGSTFEIIDREITEHNGDHVVKVKINANCKLYNQSGESKSLENVVIIGRFANV